MAHPYTDVREGHRSFLRRTAASFGRFVSRRVDRIYYRNKVLVAEGPNRLVGIYVGKHKHSTQVLADGTIVTHGEHVLEVHLRSARTAIYLMRHRSLHRALLGEARSIATQIKNRPEHVLASETMLWQLAEKFGAESYQIPFNLGDFLNGLMLLIAFDRKNFKELFRAIGKKHGRRHFELRGIAMSLDSFDRHYGKRR